MSDLGSDDFFVGVQIPLSVIIDRYYQMFLVSKVHRLIYCLLCSLFTLFAMFIVHVVNG